MTPAAILRYLVLLLAVVGVGWTGYTLYRAGNSSLRAEVATAAVTQHTAAASATRALQGTVDAAEANLRAADAARRAAAERLAAAERGVRESTPGPDAYSDATVEALREYAASLDRDFERCREAYAAVVEESAAASDTAHALSAAWPAAAVWAETAQAYSDLAKGLK